MRILIVVVFVGILVLMVGCDLAGDTATTTEDGSKGAVGLAEKMSEGTLGAADEDTGEEAEAGE